MTTATADRPFTVHATSAGTLLYDYRGERGTTPSEKFVAIINLWDRLRDGANTIDAVCFMRGLAAVGAPMRTIAEHRRMISSTIHQIVERLDETAPRHRPSMLWSMAQLRTCPYRAVKPLVAKIADDLPKYKLSKVIRVAKGMSTLGYIDWDVLHGIYNRAVELKAETSAYELAMVLYSLSSVSPALGERYLRAMAAKLTRFNGKSLWLIPIYEAMQTFGWPMPGNLMPKLQAEFARNESVLRRVKPDYTTVKAELDRLGLSYQTKVMVGPYLLDFALELGDRQIGIIVGRERTWFINGHPNTHLAGPIRLEMRVLECNGWEPVLLNLTEWGRVPDRAGYIRHSLLHV